MTTANTMYEIYAPALGLGFFDAQSDAKVNTAYRRDALTEHPDAGGDEAAWTLKTAAFNQLKKANAGTRSVLVNKGDLVWDREFEALTPKATAPATFSLRDVNRCHCGRHARRFGKCEQHQEPAKPASTSEGRDGRKRSAPSVRCGHETRSGGCVRPAGHPHGHMSAAVRDRKAANARARREA